MPEGDNCFVEGHSGKVPKEVDPATAECYLAKKETKKEKTEWPIMLHFACGTKYTATSLERN